MLSRRNFFNKAAMFVAGCALALKVKAENPWKDLHWEGKVPEITIADIEKFQRLPFYLVKNEIRHIHDYRAWGYLTGKSNWQPNMGSVTRAVV
jgi:hypothetical protein